MKRSSEKHPASDRPRCRVRPHRVYGRDSLGHLTVLEVAALWRWGAGEEHLVTLQHMLWDIGRVAAGMCKSYEVMDWEGPGVKKGRHRGGLRRNECGETGEGIKGAKCV